MKKKIVFGITSLDYGGIELSLVDLVNKLCSKYDITILTLYSGGELIPKINKKVKIESIYKHKYLSSTSEQRRKIKLKMMIASRTLYYRHLKNKYDIEIAFMEGPMTILFSTPNRNVKKIAWIHTNIAKNKVRGMKKHLKKGQNNKLYSSFDKIVFSGEIIKEKFEQYYYVDVDSCVIPNYIDISRILKGSRGAYPKEFKKNEKNLLVVTKLEKSKGIDRLLVIHKRLMIDGYNHKIYIIGDGPEKKELEKLIEKLNASDTFTLLGKRENPYPYIKHANYIVLTPSSESYGVSVLESLILKKTIISTSTSVGDRFKDYPNIISVKNNEENIYEALKYILTTKSNIKKSSIKLDNDKIIQQIYNILK